MEDVESTATNRFRAGEVRVSEKEEMGKKRETNRRAASKSFFALLSVIRC